MNFLVAGNAIGKTGSSWSKAGAWAGRDGSSWAKFGRNISQNLTSAAVRASLGGKFDVQTVVADAFGNALANSVVDGAAGAAARQKEIEGLTASERATYTQLRSDDPKLTHAAAIEKTRRLFADGPSMAGPLFAANDPSGPVVTDSAPSPLVASPQQLSAYRASQTTSGISDVTNVPGEGLLMMVAEGIDWLGTTSATIQRRIGLALDNPGELPNGLLNWTHDAFVDPVLDLGGLWVEGQTRIGLSGSGEFSMSDIDLAVAMNAKDYDGAVAPLRLDYASDAAQGWGDTLTGATLFGGAAIQAGRWLSVSRAGTTESAFAGLNSLADDALAARSGAGVVDDFPSGSFSISDWSGYPAGVPKPTGPFRLLDGHEYDAARNVANSANDALRKQWGLRGQPVDIHEVQPVKFGGSPTDVANKVVLPRDVHRQQVTPWWNQLQKDLGN